MKIKQLFIAAIIVMAAMVAQGCKKDSSVAPSKNHQIIKVATMSSDSTTDLSGDKGGPKNPHILSTVDSTDLTGDKDGPKNPHTP